jgi:hypothetical protein
MSKNISCAVGSVRSRITITSFNHLVNRLNNRPVHLDLLNKMYNIRLSALDQTLHTQKQYDYSGRLWGDRFHSTLVESAQYLSRCAAYVEYNPVRAGLTSRAINYAWNTSGRAQSGDAFAIACRAWLSETAGVTGGVATSGHAHQEQDHRDSLQMEKWMRRRQPQITKGCILGSSAFVNQSVARFEEKLGTRSARARLVDDVLFASHGYRLAKKERKVA